MGFVVVVLLIAVMYLGGSYLLKHARGARASGWPTLRQPYYEHLVEIQAVSKQVRDAIRRSSKSGCLEGRLPHLLDRLYGLELRVKQAREVQRTLVIYRKSAAYAVSQLADHAAKHELHGSLTEMTHDYKALQSALVRARN